MYDLQLAQRIVLFLNGAEFNSALHGEYSKEHWKKRAKIKRNYQNIDPTDFMYYEHFEWSAELVANKIVISAQTAEGIVIKDDIDKMDVFTNLDEVIHNQKTKEIINQMYSQNLNVNFKSKESLRIYAYNMFICFHIVFMRVRDAIELGV